MGHQNHRVFAQKCSAPGLNMSRSLGDLFGHREAGISATPSTMTLAVGDHRERFDQLTIALCSDGVWEFVENSKAMRTLSQTGRLLLPQEALESLVRDSYKHWMKDTKESVSDDITGILVHVHLSEDLRALDRRARSC